MLRISNSQLVSLDQSLVDPPYGFNASLLTQSLKPGAKFLRDVIPAGKGRVSSEEYIARVRKAQRMGFKSILRLINSEKTPEGSTVCIVGGGPSLQDNVAELRHLVKRGAKVIAVNKSHDWLLKRGFPCHYSVLLDPKDWVAGYVDLSLAKSKEIKRRAGKLWTDTKHLIASQCDDAVLNKFLSHPNAYLWHAAAGLGEGKVLREEFADDQWACIAGASVVGIRAVNIAHGLGFRKIHLFGIDGSVKMPSKDDLAKIMAELTAAGIVKQTPEDNAEALMEVITANIKLPEGVHKILRKSMYAYDKPKIDPTWKTFEVKLKSGWERPFLSNHHMARSVYEFGDSVDEWDKQIKSGKMEPFNIWVHGDPEQSAIAMSAAGMGAHYDQTMNEKYGKAPNAQR